MSGSTDPVTRVVRRAPQIIGICTIFAVLMLVVAIAFGVLWPLPLAAAGIGVIVLLVVWRKSVPDEE